MEKIRQISKLHSPRFRCLWLILHRDCLLGVAFLLGHYSWFQFESLNQSINHRRKGRHSHSSWNTPRYIFHTPDQPLKSLSFDINSLGSPQRPWAVHLHAGQAGRFIYRQSCFILNAPRRFTVQQLCTPNSTSAWQIQKTDKTACSPLCLFTCRKWATELQDRMEESPGIMKGGVGGARRQLESPAGLGSAQARDLSAFLSCLSLLKRREVEQTDGSNQERMCYSHFLITVYMWPWTCSVMQLTLIYGRVRSCSTVFLMAVAAIDICVNGADSQNDKSCLTAEKSD